MTPVISVAGLSRRYRGQLALDHVSFDIEPGCITGLLGRNGAGKTTLLRILSGAEFPTSGTVTVLGSRPASGDELLHRTVLVREDQHYPENGLRRFRVRHALRLASWFYPSWDDGLATALAADFGLPPDRPVRHLSRGMRSALGIVIGLAARAEVTMLDEPYAGLDPVARQVFYDRLLADYAEHPRTILLSTHLIDEAAGLLEQVIVLDSGKVVLDAAADAVRGAMTSVSGPALAVTEFTAGRSVASRRRMGARETAVLAGALDDADRARARSLRLTLEPLTLQQVVMHAADGPLAEGTATGSTATGSTGTDNTGARERTSA